MTPGDDKMLEMYERMVTIRQFEEKVAELFAAGFIPGFLHLYVGEEATAVGACSALKEDDYITSTHRGHGHCIAKGGDLNRMMAELFGKSGGYCKGKGGSMHIADFDLGILGANGIVGGGLALAVGAALSARMRRSKQVVVCFFGDGASNQGVFHEAMNMASILKAPVVFVCENNGYGISVSQARHMNIRDIKDRAVSYGIPGQVVDGNDVVAVYEAVSKAAEAARSGQGPSLVEAKTYRWRGHWEGDPETPYRSKAEVEQWKQKCPIRRLEKRLTGKGIATPEELAAIREKVDRRVAEAIQFAKESPYPARQEVVMDVYADLIEEGRQ